MCALQIAYLSVSVFLPSSQVDTPFGGGLLPSAATNTSKAHTCSKSSCPTIFLFSLCLCFAILKHCIYPRISAHCMFTQTSGEASRVSPPTHANSCRRQTNLSLALLFPSPFIHFPESNYLWKEASSIHSQIERFIYSISINSLTKSNNHNYCTSHFGCKVINTQKRTR